MNIEERYALAATLLNYSPATGAFRWKRSTKNRKGLTNKIAGSVNKNSGCRVIGIRDGAVQAHLLAWRMSGGGPVPEGYYVGHANGRRADNRRSNLTLKRIKS